MAATRDRQTTVNIQAMVEQIFSSGQLSRQEYVQLTNAILSDYHVTEEERRQINHVFDDILIRRLKIID